MTLSMRAITTAWCVLLLAGLAVAGSGSSPDYSLKADISLYDGPLGPGFLVWVLNIDYHETIGLEPEENFTVLATAKVEAIDIACAKSWSENISVLKGLGSNFVMKDLFPDFLCGDLNVTLSCTSVDQRVKPFEYTWIIPETRKVTLSAVETDCPQGLCVKLTTNMALSTNLTLTVTVKDLHENSVNESIQVLEAQKDMLQVQFSNLQHKGYIVSVDYDRSSPLAKWIILPPDIVAVNMSMIDLLNLVDHLQENLTECSKRLVSNSTSTEGINPTSISSNSATEKSTTKKDNASPESTSTLYMKWIVFGGGSVVILIIVIGYLIFRYKDKVVAVVGSVKFPGGIPQPINQSLRKGGRYTKLPQTMQEALHQD